MEACPRAHSVSMMRSSNFASLGWPIDTISYQCMHYYYMCRRDARTFLKMENWERLRKHEAQKFSLEGDRGLLVGWKAIVPASPIRRNEAGLRFGMLNPAFHCLL